MTQLSKPQLTSGTGKLVALLLSISSLLVTTITKVDNSTYLHARGLDTAEDLEEIFDEEEEPEPPCAMTLAKAKREEEML